MSYVARQPNGLLCRFSKISDCPTHWNMTEEEYIELKAEEGRQEAREVLHFHLQPFDSIKEDIRFNNMSEEMFKEFLKQTRE